MARAKHSPEVVFAPADPGNSARESVLLPKGAFALAKMIDGIISQQESYDLEEVMEGTVEGYLERGMSWGEMSNLVFHTALFKWRPS